MPRATRALELCGECVCFAARKAARRLTRLYDDPLAGTGLRSTQFTLLVLVHELGYLAICGVGLMAAPLFSIRLLGSTGTYLLHR